MGKWTTNEAQIFAKALQVCGKNFSAIKKDYLPWKSVRSIIEFYYYSVDKDNEQKKKSPKHLDKQNKSPIDESKRKRSSKDDGPESSYKSSDKQNVQETSSNGTSDNGASLAADSEADSGKSCTNQEDGCKDELVNPDSTSILKSNTTVNGSHCDNTIFKAINGNINGNHVLINDHKRNSVPGQEVRPIKAKPVVQNEVVPDGDENCLLSNSTLGSLNLYLHGELVLKLNAQQQDSGQKWVESMEVPPKKKRSMMANSNGLPGTGRMTSLKRSIDSKGGHLLKEDTDDLSTCGGDVSASDDDSMTSNESSSLVASSPSSSSTINSAAKKARVKVENLSSLASNGTSISPPNSSRKSETSGSVTSNGSKQRTGTQSPSIVDGEIELKKKLLEANLNLNLFRIENGQLPLLFNGPVVGGGLFEPPKAHSNAAAISPQYPPHHPLHVANASPVKNMVKPEPTMNGHANGFSTGPVDLTRKPTNGHSSELLSASPLHSPSRQRNSHSSLSPMPKAAHEASNSSISANRLLSSSLGLFSLPAPPPPPPPPNVPVSPNGHSKHLKKPLIRTGGVQFAK